MKREGRSARQVEGPTERDGDQTIMPRNRVASVGRRPIRSAKGGKIMQPRMVPSDRRAVPHEASSRMPLHAKAPPFGKKDDARSARTPHRPKPDDGNGQRAST